MSNHILLLGAGFSSNWGGWLASEAFEYLLGAPEIAHDDAIKNLLWRHKVRGGFEAALADLQAEYVGRRDQHAKDRLGRFQAAVRNMFRDMNRAFDKIVDFEPARPPQVGQRVVDFLARFDAIFTLNQDLLLERHYRQAIPIGPPRNWSGVTFPGILPEGPTQPFSFLDQKWRVSQSIDLLGTAQPIFKLHGSSNWLDQSGDELLIIGGNKSHAIQSHNILKRYHEIFVEHLRKSGTRLMVIGYSFSDGHIDLLIKDAAKAGLHIFIIDPLGSDVVNKTRDAAIRASDPLEDLLIGGSRRSLREIFGGDGVEHAKVMRFFTV